MQCQEEEAVKLTSKNTSPMSQRCRQGSILLLPMVIKYTRVIENTNGRLCFLALTRPLLRMVLRDWTKRNDTDQP